MDLTPLTLSVFLTAQLTLILSHHCGYGILDIPHGHSLIEQGIVARISAKVFGVMTLEDMGHVRLPQQEAVIPVLETLTLPTLEGAADSTTRIVDEN